MVWCRWSHSVTARGSRAAVRSRVLPGRRSRQIPYLGGAPPVPGGLVFVLAGAVGSPGGLVPVPGGPVLVSAGRVRPPGGGPRGSLLRRRLPRRLGRAQPWAVGCPCWSVIISSPRRSVFSV